VRRLKGFKGAYACVLRSTDSSRAVSSEDTSHSRWGRDRPGGEELVFPKWGWGSENFSALGAGGRFFPILGSGKVYSYFEFVTGGPARFNLQPYHTTLPRHFPGRAHTRRPFCTFAAPSASTVPTSPLPPTPSMSFSSPRPLSPFAIIAAPSSLFPS
jgi:hypothetical protein